MNLEKIENRFMKYVSFNVIGMIGLSCYILADTFFVANGVGIHGLTALNLAIPIYSFIHGTGLMIGMGGATRFTISKSKNIFTQSLYYVLFMSAFFLIIGLFFTELLAEMLGGNQETLNYTITYLKTILCFAPMFLLNNVLICFIRNDGNPKLSMMAMLVGSFSNIVLDYVFVYPLQMGMFGAAFATGLAPVISLLCLSKHFICKHNSFHINRIKMKLKELKDISLLGAAALITELSSGIVIIVFNMIILNLEGNTGVAAYGIVANIALVIIAIFTGISQGMQPLISLSHAKSQLEDMRKILRYGVLCAIVVAITVLISSFVYAEEIVALFNSSGDPLLSVLASLGMRLYFTAFIFVGINILCASYFSASDNPKYALIISVLRGLVLIIPISIILAKLFGMNGVWLAMTCTEFIVFLVALFCLKQSRNCIKKTTEVV